MVDKELFEVANNILYGWITTAITYGIVSIFATAFNVNSQCAITREAPNYNGERDIATILSRLHNIGRYFELHT